jgi:hypothetical protein
MVGVVCEPHGDAAAERRGQRADHRLAERRRQPEIVDRDVEADPGLAEERRERVGDLGGRLAPVRQQAELDQVCFAFSDAL